MFWEKKLAQWVEDVKTKANLPARLVLWDGQQHDFGQFAAPQVTLHVKSATALPYLLEPSLDNLGEAYVKGKIDIEGKLSDIINVSYQLARNTVTSASKLARVRRYFNHSKASDKKAIQYHYDVSNEFYKLWLDENMVYSCAYFENGDEDLATAQIKKIDHILTKIQLQPGQRLLDIGCGWGALVLRAAQKFGAKCVGVTLSQNQFDLATARVKAAGLESPGCAPTTSTGMPSGRNSSAKRSAPAPEASAGTLRPRPGMTPTIATSANATGSAAASSRLSAGADVLRSA